MLRPLQRIDRLVDRILMGLARVEESVAQLIAAGRPGSTPAAAISAGTTDQQQVVTASLAELPAALAAARLSTPTMIVVGEAAALSSQLAWFTASGDAAGFVPVETQSPPLLAMTA